jgi:FkbM family methyltransferase
MSWNSFKYRTERILTRPRAFWRASRKLGVSAAFSLIRIRLGSRQTVYELRVPRLPHPVYLRGGSSSDTMVLYEIFVTDEYDLIEDLGAPQFVIDGGANIGLFSLYFLNRYPTARIVAVEPDAETVEVCRKNLAGYAARTTIVHGAIWSRAGSLILEPTGEEWTASVRSPGAGEAGSTEAFTMPSLIALGRGAGVDLLKLDVEGGEREIFGANAQEWLPSVSNIVIELHGPDCMDRFFSALTPYQYEESHRDSVYVCRNIRPRVHA